MPSVKSHTPTTTNLVFTGFNPLHVYSDELGNVLMVQGHNVITFPAAMSEAVRESISLAEQGET